MNPERHDKTDKIFTIFQAALELDQDRRNAFLDRQCEGDAEMRREVEALLAYDERAEKFIESPAFEHAPELMVDDEGSSLTMEAVGPFKIVRRLGSGGMGDVYLARDSRLDRNVALKLLDRNLIGDSQSRTRFLREARLASALDHPNICTIHEIGEASGVLFIAMQYLEGDTLKQVIGSRPLSLDNLFSISMQVGNALAAAHAQGIIHRDIKSSNIIVTPRGQAKVLDFGLAKPLEKEDGETELTQAGAVMGTPTYMSPEQARGERADHRSDIFSFGVVMYEMATGRTPFKSKSRAETMNAVINQPHVPAVELNTDVPSELCAVIDRALAKQPDDRYQSVDDMKSDLCRVAQTVGLSGYSSSDPLMVPYVPVQRSGQTARMANLIALRSRWQVAAIGLVALMVAAIIYVKFFRDSTSLSAGDIRSLAVLPLENLSGDPSQEYFADGMTDALIGDLAKIRGLQVISRTSAMHYKGSNKPLREIAGELRVDAVVEGTVQRSGDRIQVRAQLIHAATDRHLWAESYERDLRDALALQSEIAHAVVREIQIKIMPSERARLTTNRPVNRKAFDDYLQGRFLYWNRRTDENLYKAISFFQSAVNEDHNYAPAYVGLADCYIALGTELIGALPPLDARRQSQEAANKALEIDNDLAEAHVALGSVKHYNWDWAAAEQEYKHAIELNPNYAQAHSGYGSFLVAKGRTDEAIAEANRAQELDPFSLGISSQRGFILENARRYDEAIEQLRRVIAMDPNNYQAHWFLGHTCAASGRFAEAIAASEKAAALSRTPGALGFLGMCYGLSGRKAEANKILNELLELNRSRYVTPPALANVYIGLGDKDQAFFWLEKAYQDRSNYMAYLKVFPADDPLRSDPRLDNLLGRMGLAP
jgi:eukaryotic-like serine/threonine-protein kinase